MTATQWFNSMKRADREKLYEQFKLVAFRKLHSSFVKCGDALDEAFAKSAALTVDTRDEAEYRRLKQWAEFRRRRAA